MMNQIRIDEKWFYLRKDRLDFYLTESEDAPYHSAVNKRHNEKVMFLGAVARPRDDTHRKTNFSGKTGCWPFVKQAPTQRSSRDREAGTLVTTNVNVTSAVYEEFLLTKLPAVKAK